MIFKNLLFFISFFSFNFFLFSHVFAANKTIYIKPFPIEQGLTQTDPIGRQCKDYISEYLIEKGGYTIISDDEVKQVITQEELKMSLDKCYDDACIKELMKSIKTDYIIYGSISFIDNLFYVTAKMLDRTSGTVILARVKTIKFGARKILGAASKALGEYLLTGDDEGIKNLDGLDKSGDGSAVFTGRKANIVNRQPFIRYGGTPGLMKLSDKDMDRTYINETSLDNMASFIDIFFYRTRYSESSGFDLFLRGIFKHIEISNPTHKDVVRYKKNSGYIEPQEFSGYNIEMNQAVFEYGGADLGLRYITGTYAFGIHWQPYLFLAYQYTFFISERTEFKALNAGSENNDEYFSNHKKYSSNFGLLGGIGLEIGLFKYFGLFVEIDYGYIPAEVWGRKRNIDGFSFLFGFSLRTSYL